MFLSCVPRLSFSLKNKLGQAITVLRMYHHKVGVRRLNQGLTPLVLHSHSYACPNNTNSAFLSSWCQPLQSCSCKGLMQLCVHCSTRQRQQQTSSSTNSSSRGRTSRSSSRSSSQSLVSSQTRQLLLLRQRQHPCHCLLHQQQSRRRQNLSSSSSRVCARLQPAEVLSRTQHSMHSKMARGVQQQWDSSSSSSACAAGCCVQSIPRCWQQHHLALLVTGWR